jgi:hypothetical protein
MRCGHAPRSYRGESVRLEAHQDELSGSGYTLDMRKNRTARNRPIQSGQVGMDLPRGRYGGGRRDFFLHSLGLVPYLYGAVPTSIGVKCVHAHYAAPLPPNPDGSQAHRPCEPSPWPDACLRCRRGQRWWIPGGREIHFAYDGDRLGNGRQPRIRQGHAAGRWTEFASGVHDRRCDLGDADQLGAATSGAERICDAP